MRRRHPEGCTQRHQQLARAHRGLHESSQHIGWEILRHILLAGLANGENGDAGVTEAREKLGRHLATGGAVEEIGRGPVIAVHVGRCRDLADLYLLAGQSFRHKRGRPRGRVEQQVFHCSVSRIESRGG